MKETMEKAVQREHGEYIDEIALALMKGDFRIIGIEQNFYGVSTETVITTVVKGVEMDIRHTKYNSI